MPIPVIIDCDPGTDDALALLLAFGSPELDVRAVTVAGGNVGIAHTLANACALAGLAGMSMPVHAGADRPLLPRRPEGFVAVRAVHGEAGLGGVVLPPGAPPAPGVAADAIRAILRAAEQPVTLIGLAPATNFALALMTEPELAARVAAVVLMAGAWGEGNLTPAAEFNAFNDPEALAFLIGCGRPVALATIDLAPQALATPARLAALRAAGTGRCLRAACEIQASVPASRRFGGVGAPLYDPCAVAWAIRPALFTTRACHVEVDLGPGPGRGRTVIDRWGRTGAAANVTLLETLDSDLFFALLAERLSRLP